MKTQYLSFEALAVILGLPRSYLRTLVNQGEIPFLDVNGRKMFSERQVRECLEHKAKLFVKK